MTTREYLEYYFNSCIQRRIETPVERGNFNFRSYSLRQVDFALHYTYYPIYNIFDIPSLFGDAIGVIARNKFKYPTSFRFPLICTDRDYKCTSMIGTIRRMCSARNEYALEKVLIKDVPYYINPRLILDSGLQILMYKSIGFSKADDGDIIKNNYIYRISPRVFESNNPAEKFIASHFIPYISTRYGTDIKVEICAPSISVESLHQLITPEQMIGLDDAVNASFRVAAENKYEELFL